MDTVPWMLTTIVKGSSYSKNTPFMDAIFIFDWRAMFAETFFQEWHDVT